MKDNLQRDLEAICNLQFWMRKQIKKEKEISTIINTGSIQSAKQRFNFSINKDWLPYEVDGIEMKPKKENKSNF